MREVTLALLHLLRAGGRGALATVVETRGSTPQQAGARLLWREDGSTVGTVGGGAIEALVVRELEATCQSGVPRLLRSDLTRELAMCCGGHMQVFLEPVKEAAKLFLLGAGHIAVPTARLARDVGFSVHVVDEREELVTAERFPHCQRHLIDAPAFVKRTAFRDEDWVLIVTHDHALDETLLELVTQRPHAYVGLVGSRRKVLRIVERVRARAPNARLDRLYAPVGLDVGAVSPEEIAVSIVSEWLALRNDKAVPHLRLQLNP